MPQLLTAVHFPTARLQSQRLCCQGFLAIPTRAASLGEGAFSSSCRKSPFWAVCGGPRLHRWSWGAVARSSSLCSHGTAVSLTDFSRNPQISGRRAAAQFITHGLLVFYSPACSQVTFVCIIIWSSVIWLPYFASCKNSTEMRFDLFPTTEIIVSCLLPRSS